MEFDPASADFSAWLGPGLAVGLVLAFAAIWGGVILFRLLRLRRVEKHRRARMVVLDGERPAPIPTGYPNGEFNGR